MLIFKSELSRIKRWLDRNGYLNDTVDGELMQLFSSLSGLSDGVLEDHINQHLDNLGYSAYGTLNDKVDAFFVVTMNIPHAKDAERAFWDSDSSSWGGGTTPDNLVYNLDRDVIKNMNGTQIKRI